MTKFGMAIVKLLISVVLGVFGVLIYQHQSSAAFQLSIALFFFAAFHWLYW